MKTFPANRCPHIATVALVMLVMPLTGVAQEQPQEQAQNDAAPAQAQPVAQRRFVSDKLVLNVYADPDQGSARVATIQTGDAVDELERSGNLVRVRLADGREGWVGASYLTSDMPAAARLRELQQEQKSATPRTAEKELAAEIASLKKQNTTLRAQVGELQSKAAPAAAAATAPTASADSASISVAEAAGVMSPQSEPADVVADGGGTAGWLIAVLLTGVLGFAAGYQALARRLRKKFGGLKVY